MKIKEAIKIINSTKTVRASLEKEKIYFCEYTASKFDYFLVMPQKADKWDDVKEDFEALYSITPKDLALVMDVVQRLICTPVNERFPEKKYRLRWINDGDNRRNYFSYILNGEWHLVTEKGGATIFAESELNQLKTDNPHLAPAIDAMKEPAEDKDDEAD